MVTVHRIVLNPLVVARLVGISEVEDDSTMRLSTTAVGELAWEVNAAVEAEAAIRKNINPWALKSP